MTYLLDTHALLWFLTHDRNRLGSEALRLFDRMGSTTLDVRFSVVSLWETALLTEKNRVRLARPWDAWFHAACRAPGFALEHLIADDVDNARALPSLVDPHDRLIVGTALRLDATLVTNDERITESRVVPTAW